MGRAWADYREPGYMPAESFLFTGADPSWTPEREGKTLRAQPAPDREACPVCGGEAAAREGADALEVSELVVTACGRCMRSTYEGRLRGRVSIILDTDVADAEHRTTAAVEPERAPDRPPTRKERRAAVYGTKGHP
jgi:hypothetical protein